MTLGARLRQRLDALSSGRLKLAALAVLLVYAITIFCSVVVQVTMTIAAVAKDPVIVAAADSVGALLVCGVMVWAAWELARVSSGGGYTNASSCPPSAARAVS